MLVCEWLISLSRTLTLTNCLFPTRNHTRQNETLLLTDASLAPSALASRRKDQSITDDEVPNRVIHLNGNGNRGTTEASGFALPKQQQPSQPQVNWDGGHVEMIVRKLQSTSWEEQRMVLTQDVLALGPLSSRRRT
jgi:hypothetical protein